MENGCDPKIIDTYLNPSPSSNDQIIQKIEVYFHFTDKWRFTERRPETNIAFI